jgi:hypothetical protein
MEERDRGPGPSLLVRPQRLLGRAREAYLERRHQEAVERCREALEALLPAPGAEIGDGEERGGLFLATWSEHLPAVEAARITAVFTYFERRREQFRFERGRPLPAREWWRMIGVSREDASEALTATRIAIEAIRRGLEGR